MTDTDDEPQQPRVIEPAKDGLQDRSRLAKILITVVIVTAVAGLGVVAALDTIHRRQDLADARTVSGQVITALANHDGKAAHALGSTEFQHDYSAGKLNQQFGAIEMVTQDTPTIDSQRLVSAKSGDQSAFIVYKYPPKLANSPFYVMVVITEHDGKWQLTNLSGSADKAQLVRQ